MRSQFTGLLLLCLSGCSLNRIVPGLPLQQTGQPVEPVPAVQVKPQSSTTASVTLAWNCSKFTWATQCNPAVVGYHLYQGGQSHTYTNMLVVADYTNALVWVSPGGTYYFAVAAYDTNRLESKLSNELRYLVPVQTKKPPGKATPAGSVAQ